MIRERSDASFSDVARRSGVGFFFEALESSPCDSSSESEWSSLLEDISSIDDESLPDEEVSSSLYETGICVFPSLGEEWVDEESEEQEKISVSESEVRDGEGRLGIDDLWGEEVRSVCDLLWDEVGMMVSR